MQKKTILLLGAIGLLIAACSKSNPVLRTDPDTFAISVNHFEKKDFENNIAAMCGNYYVHPDELKKSFPYLASETEKNCKKDLRRLSVYLNTLPIFSGITQYDLEQKSTWIHYFKSKKAHGELKG